MFLGDASTFLAKKRGFRCIWRPWYGPRPSVAAEAAASEATWLLARAPETCYEDATRTFGSAEERRQVTLTLTMLRCPDTVAPETRVLQGGEFSIGRGSENDWVLSDRERFLSKRHCILAYRSGNWQIADLSANGTFLNGEAEPVGHNRPRDLRDGDRLRLGAYEIELRIADTATSRGAPVALGDPFALDPLAARPPAAGGPFDQDPLLGRGSGPDPFAEALAPASINSPRDYDLFPRGSGNAPFAGPTRPDHSPPTEDAFRPPVPHSLLPDDWDREPASEPPAPAPPVPASGPPPTTLFTETPVPAPAPVPAPVPVPAPPAAPAAVTPGDDLLMAFLRGTGLRDARPTDPAAAMEALGTAFRALISGLRLVMIARSAIKGEFRIEQTMIRSRGNNPLKFSADDDDAMLALLGAGRRLEMGPAEAVTDALRDIRLHEIATVAAMRSAVRSMISRFDPGRLRLAAEQSGLNLVPVQRKARAWDAFEALFAQTCHALTDDFDSVFGRAFARAYEQALAETRERDTDR
jgi:type VI secretion system FHA domain protein